MLKRKCIILGLCAFMSLNFLGCKTNKMKPNLDQQKPANTQEQTSTDKKGTGDGKESPGGTETPSQQEAEEKVKVKGVYITGSTAGSAKRLEHFIELTKTTEINTVVLDIKDNGEVYYQSEVPDVKKYGAIKKLYDVDEVLRKLHENNVHVIARLVVFKDPLLPAKRSDLAIRTPDGAVYKEKGKTPWVNPYEEEVWKYNIEIAKEAIAKGFDEIQFDYVRFPAAKKSQVSFGANPPPKSEAIGNFLKMARKELGDKVVISADVFGIICETPGDIENIGQDLEKIGLDVDYISPMIYPSHYANKAQNGVGQSVNGVLFEAPDLKPYDVIYQSLAKCKERISKVQDYKASVRPYLQDFTATWLKKGYYQTYGPEQLKQQVQAVYDAGYEEWILWDPLNTYSEEGLVKK